MRKICFSFGMCLALILMLMIQIGSSMTDGLPPRCKELNHVACYAGQNEGYFCSKKDQTTKVERWFNDKGSCRKFDYKGCYGNRNRFCTKEECERRCLGNGDVVKSRKSLNHIKNL